MKFRTKDKKIKSIGARCTTEEYEKLKIIGETENTRLAEVIRSLINEYYEKNYEN